MIASWCPLLRFLKKTFASPRSGRYPHNTGYVDNNDKASYQHYLAEQNNSVGTWVTAAGYETSFLGKVRFCLQRRA